MNVGGTNSCIERFFTPVRAVYILTFVLFLNYVDRGIIAGAGTSIKGCVANSSRCGSLHKERACDGNSTFIWNGGDWDSSLYFDMDDKWRESIEMQGFDNVIDTVIDEEELLHLLQENEALSNRTICNQCKICGYVCDGETNKQTGFGINTAQLGVLQSMFMVGYVLGALFFGHLVNRVKPFKLISFGLFLWVISCILGGLSGFLCEEREDGICWAYYLMVFARALSGVGEASLNTLTLPFLDDILEPASKGFYIGIYYTAIPCGTAFGFMWAGVVSDFTQGLWEWAFLLEAPFMIPFVIFFYFVPYDYHFHDNNNNNNNNDNNIRAVEDIEQEQVEEEGSLADSMSEPLLSIAEQTVRKMTVLENIWGCLSSPAFVLGCCGYAIYTGVIAGLGFYGPLFIQTYRPCDERWDISQIKADIIFGMIISSSGFIGTILGGTMVDRIDSNEDSRKDRNDLLKQLLMQTCLGFAISIGSTTFTNPFLFFIVLFFGSCLLFMVTAGINLLLVWTVPKVNRPMSGALTVLAIHLFGDVPSPILIGYISDNYSPLFTLIQTLLWLLLAITIWMFILPLEYQQQPQCSTETVEDPVEN